MTTRELKSARRVVSREEMQALEKAEAIRLEAEELLREARVEAQRIVEESRREAEEARMTVRRQLLGHLVMLRDAMERADESLRAFVESAL